MKHLLIILTTLGTFLCAKYAGAEENGSGTYAPGSIASHIDSMLPAPGWIVRTNYYDFFGKNKVDCLELSCANRVNTKASVEAVSVTLGWRPNIDLGPRYSYMMSVVVPYLWVDVASAITSNSTGSPTLLRGKNQGIGDMELIPLNLSYHVDERRDVNFKLIGRAPTGEFDKNKLANLGKNYWSVEPTVSYLYNDSRALLQGALYAGVNLNETNPDTHFHSGSQAHVEFTLKKQFMYGNGQLGAGVTGYTYRQISDDSGSGVVVANKRANLSGIGPVVSYAGDLFGQFAVAELKWIHDYEIDNRFGGDTVILKTGLIF